MAHEHEYPDLHDHGDEHDHAHPAGHDHGEGTALPIIEEPLDPANQSLADALRASFRVLKLVMAVVVVLFLCSGIYIVHQGELVVQSRFGVKKEPARSPGLWWAFPYPIDDKIRVPTTVKNMTVDAFWLQLRDSEKTVSLSDLSPRSTGLDPAVDGALVTGDKAIMHLKFTVQYSISDALRYVENVRDEERLMQAILRDAAVAEAARTSADVLWRDPKTLVAAVRVRAQQNLNRINAGITLENISADNSYFPLQAKEQFLAVSTAENKKRELINEAQSEQYKKLNGVAGPAWEDINALVERIDQIKSEEQRAELVAEIKKTIAARAEGQAGGTIRLAERDREKIIADTLAEVSRFKALLPQYKLNPELVRLRLGQAMLKDLYKNVNVAKWILPAGAKHISLWLNKDPKEIAEAEKARMEAKLKKQRGQ